MTIVIALLKQFWKPLALVIGIALLGLLVYWVKHNYDEGKIEKGRIEGRAEVQALWDEDKLRRQAALEKQKTLWEEEAAKAEKAAKERDEQYELRVKETRALVAKLPRSVARTAVPPSVVELLNNAARDTGPASSGTSRTTKAVSPASAVTKRGKL